MAIHGNIEYHAVDCPYIPEFGFGEKGSDVKPNIKGQLNVNHRYTMLSLCDMLYKVSNFPNSGHQNLQDVNVRIAMPCIGAMFNWVELGMN